MDLKEKSLQYFKEQAHMLPVIQGLDRTLAMNIYQSLGFPDPRMEKWQKSRIRHLIKKDSDWSFDPKSPSDSKEGDVKIPLEVMAGITFSNGRLSGAESWFESPDGLKMGSLGQALKRYPELVEQHLAIITESCLNGLNALNNALFRDGLFIHVPKNGKADLPFYWANLAFGNDSGFTQMRNLIIIESGAVLELIQSDGSTDQGSLFRNSVTEVFIGANARLNWYVEQDLRKEDALVNSVFCHQEQDSYFKVIHTSLRAGMIRNEVHIKMDGTGCDTNILGLYMPVSGEQVDNQVFVEHAQPHCVSNELFKGVLDGSGSSIFNGHILVQQDAQKTNAYQTNRNILLSDEANAFAKPFLEIYADDVRCSHGATIGQLDKEALFYLRSRGLSEEKAKSYLIHAFVGEVTEQCENEDFRNYLEEKVFEKLHQNT